MRKYWWKILSALIILYSIVAGLISPLNSGILKVKPSNLQTGQSYTLIINTYNTNYDQATPVDAWIKIDSVAAIAATTVKPLNNNQLEATFTIPEHLPFDKKNWSFPIILNDSENGAFVRPSAVAITQTTVNPQLARDNWTQEAIGNLTVKSGMKFPFRSLIYETIRNTFYHVPLWFAMTLLFLAAAIFSGKYLSKGKPSDDIMALSFTRVGVLFGILGCVTGSIWAKNTWGTWWTLSEIKLNVSAIAMLIYLAYFVLRNSFDDEERRARVSSVYSVFAFVATVPLLFVIPRMVEGSLHPGNGGNPGFGGEDLDNTMRMVFYPAIIGWTLFGVWLTTLAYRMDNLRYRLMDDE